MLTHSVIQIYVMPYTFTNKISLINRFLSNGKWIEHTIIIQGKVNEQQQFLKKK